jgi:predicted dehydrogenase
MPLRIALLGIGKIARDQHLPALAVDAHFELVAAASHDGKVEGIANYPDLQTLLKAVPDLDCLSICTPPQAHFDAALLALRAGCHVMLEKPPAATTRQIGLLAEEAARQGRTLFQTWHSRFAAAVDATRNWLAPRELTGAKIVWKEDVRQWHPGQRWIWEPGGFGVFDPGINALSLLTEVLAEEVHVERARLEFPSNLQAPIAARLLLRTLQGLDIDVEFDFRQQGEQHWDIELQTHTGTALLSRGGAALAVDGRSVIMAEGLAGEYPRLYERFATLCAAGRSEVDVRPFQLVADAFLVGERRLVAPHEI